MASRLRFVSYQDKDDGMQQLRSRRACTQCRHRKKRCNHPPQLSGQNPSLTSPLVWKEPRTPHQSQTRASARIGPGALAETPTSPPMTEEDQHQSQPRSSPQDDCAPDAHPSSPALRFVGDLNPEARLLDETTSPESAEGTVPGDVGLWVQPPKSCHKCAASADRNYHPGTPAQNPSPVSDLVPNSSVEALSNIYFDTIHPIIPLLDEADYRHSVAQGNVPMLLVHIVCLLAAKHSSAEKHLRFIHHTNPHRVVSAREFCSQLYLSVTAALARGRSSLRRLTLIRALGLLSLHQEGHQGMEEASSCIAQAIHYAQSSALHQPRPNDTDHQLKRIFWCLWSLDRWNAALNSRPCMIQDIDIAVTPIMPYESASVAFDVFYRIAKMLNVVIGLYRPKKDEDADTGWDSDFPGFEQIVDEMQAWTLPVATVETLHVFYLATAILAHRLKSIVSLPTLTPSRLRQRLSSIQVIRYMEDRERLNALHPLPVVVYAASLAMSVSYQQLRYSRLSSEQDEARRDFDRACATLQELRRKWASADAMASLAQRTCKALNQLPSLALLRVNGGSRQQQQPQTEASLSRDIAGSGDADMSQAAAAAATPNVDKDRAHETASTNAEIESMAVTGMGSAGPQAQQPLQQPFPENMDLFSGMDDLSWMYLDAENPANLENLLATNFDESLNSWQ